MYTNILNNQSNKNEIIEELKNLYSDALINDILNNNDPLIKYYYNNMLIS
jgi:hypothetical protein